jgi:hypothetical protein
MALTLSQSATYKWPVRITLPAGGDAVGKREVHTFDAEFRRLPQTRVNEIIQLVRDQERGRRTDEEALVQDTDVAREVMAGWTGVVDDDGKQIPYSESVRDQLLEIPTVASQIVFAWFDSNKDGKRKN